MKIVFQCIEPAGNLAVQKFDDHGTPLWPPLFILECTGIDDLADALKAHLGSAGDGEPLLVDTLTGEIEVL
jgi:hypothetical protein